MKIMQHKRYNDQRTLTNMENYYIICVHCKSLLEVHPRWQEGYIFVCNSCKGINCIQGWRVTQAIKNIV